MDSEPVLIPLDTNSKAQIYRKEGNYIYPLPLFVTKRTFEKPSYAEPPDTTGCAPSEGQENADFSM